MATAFPKMAMEITLRAARLNFRERGFTLIELIIALAIVALLAAVALPSYESQLIQTRRSDGTTALTSFAQRMERYFLEQGSYSGATTSLYQEHSTQGHYQLSVSSTVSSYQLTATAVGAQSADDECGSLTLNEQSTRGISGSGLVEGCW
jgi:type IV pilus assembly protein PilE